MSGDVAVIRAIEGERTTTHDPSLPEPLPLFPEPEAPEPYPLEALGALSAGAAALARKVQVPAALAAQSVLAAASLAAQAHADVLMPYGQTRPLSLYLATIAASGDRKSTADNEALWPVHSRERALREIYDRDVELWNIDQALWAAQRKKIEGDSKIDGGAKRSRLVELGPEPAGPLYPVLTAPDPTVEGLTKAWISAPAALGIFTAEGGQFVGGYGMSADHRLKTAATYSAIWDGSPIKRIRAGDGVTILSDRRLAMHIMIQPDAATQLLADPLLRDQGLLSRLLVAAPESIAGRRLYAHPDPKDDLAIKSYGALILALLEAPWPLVPGKRNELAPRALTFSSGALRIWEAFHNHIEAQTNTGEALSSLKDFAAKASENAARIAGVLAIAESLNTTEIKSATMKSAVVLADWYVGEALRLHQSSKLDTHLLGAQQLLNWLVRRAEQQQGRDVALRDILQHGPAPFRTKSAADGVLHTLVKHGRIVEITTRPRMFRLVEVAA